MNGRVLAGRLAPRHPAMKVLYIRGYTDSFIAERRVLEEGITPAPQTFHAGSRWGARVRELLDAGQAANADRRYVTVTVDPPVRRRPRRPRSR